MFAVCEVNTSTIPSESIIEMIDDENELSELIQRYINSHPDNKSHICDKITIHHALIIGTQQKADVLIEEIRTDSKYMDGYYLITESKQIRLIQKLTRIDTGYIYNSSVSEIILLYLWKTIPIVRINTSTVVDFDHHTMIEHPNIVIHGPTYASVTMMTNNIVSHLLSNNNVLPYNIYVIDLNHPLDPNMQHQVDPNIQHRVDPNIQHRVDPNMQYAMCIDEEQITTLLRMQSQSDAVSIVIVIYVDSKTIHILNSGLFSVVMYNGRHYRITVIIGVIDHQASLLPSYRANCNYVILLPTHSFRMKRKYWQSYVNMVPTFLHFDDLFRKYIDNDIKTALVINNTIKSNNATDHLQRYVIEI